MIQTRQTRIIEQKRAKGFFSLFLRMKKKKEEGTKFIATLLSPFNAMRLV